MIITYPNIVKTRKNIISSTLVALGSSGLVTIASNSPSLFTLDSRTFLNGHILIREPIRNPESRDNISFLKFANINDKTLLKIIKPKIQPRAKTDKICKSKLLIALIINSYFERSSRINEPLIPGRIVAVIAIEPDINTKIGVPGVEAGERNEIRPATIIPKIR